MASAGWPGSWSADYRWRWAERLWAAQGQRCPVCGDQMLKVDRLDPQLGWTLEHVWPKRCGYRLLGNLLTSHAECNNLKGDRDPTLAEQAMLLAVNRRIGLRLQLKSQPTTTAYCDQISAPSALAIALEQARERRARA